MAAAGPWLQGSRTEREPCGLPAHQAPPRLCTSPPAPGGSRPRPLQVGSHKRLGVPGDDNLLGRARSKTPSVADLVAGPTREDPGLASDYSAAATPATRPIAPKPLARQTSPSSRLRAMPRTTKLRAKGPQSISRLTSKSPRRLTRRYVRDPEYPRARHEGQRASLSRGSGTLDADGQPRFGGRGTAGRRSPCW